MFPFCYNDILIERNFNCFLSSLSRSPHYSYSLNVLIFVNSIRQTCQENNAKTIKIETEGRKHLSKNLNRNDNMWVCFFNELWWRAIWNWLFQESHSSCEWYIECVCFFFFSLIHLLFADSRWLKSHELLSFWCFYLCLNHFILRCSF